MSYACTTEARIPYFSNPNVLYNGQPTGVLGANDTARSMNAAASTVAGFRAAVGTLPAAPGNPTATATGADSVAMTWTDNADDAVGYKLQSSADGTAWVAIAAQGASSASFADTGLLTGQTYCDRAYAYNSVGSSGRTPWTRRVIWAGPACG